MRQREGHDLVLSVLMLLSIFGCVLLHELAHAGMARLFGVTTREIVLYPIGGVARLEHIPGGRAELLIALAGPAVNLVIFVGLALLMALAAPDTFRMNQLLLSWTDILPWLLLANVMLFAFNLIPAFPMDGGRVFRALLSMALPIERATVIAAAVGQGIAALFGLGGIIFGQFLLVLIAIFVFLGASQETAMLRQRASVISKTARDAMITRLARLAPQDSLADASRLLLEGSQQVFPVVDAWDRLVGVLPRFMLLDGLNRLGSSAAVLDVMSRDATIIEAETALEQVMQLLRSNPRFPVFVMADEKLIGMITLEHLAGFVEVSRASTADGSGAQSR
jgi:Zn-dependent protease